MEFLTLFASVFCLPITAPHLRGVLVANLSCGNWSLPSFLCQGCFLIAIREIVRRDTQPFVLKPEDLSVRAMVPSELTSLGFSLAVLR